MKSIPETLQKIKDSGLKLTPQRLAILEILHRQSGHPTARTVYRLAKRRFPMISFATVYKTLKMLTSIGEIQCLRAHEDRISYDPVTDFHSHFLCKECGALQDITIDNTPAAGDIEGHRISGCQVVYSGVCSRCQGMS